PVISTDGRFVAFESTASNLVPDDTNLVSDVFVHDRVTGVTERVSVASDGTQGTGSSTAAAISADGRFVAFVSTASELVGDDNNGSADVFVHDRMTGVTQRVSVGPGGLEADGASGSPALSANGMIVAFQSSADNLVRSDTNGMADVFLHDLVSGATVRASVGVGGTEPNGLSSAPSLSADGMLAVFMSAGNNLVAS